MTSIEKHSARGKKARRNNLQIAKELPGNLGEAIKLIGFNQRTKAMAICEKMLDARLLDTPECAKIQKAIDCMEVGLIDSAKRLLKSVDATNTVISNGV